MMERCPRTTQRLNNVIRGFLEKRGLLNNDPGWEVRESDVGGFGVYVNRDYDVGEVIFRDCPVIIGPRCVPECPRICANCFSNVSLHPCEKDCGLELCNKSCQNSHTHLKECKILRQHQRGSFEITNRYRQELFENLTPIRSLFLDEEDRQVVSCLIAHDRDEHGHEIDTLKNKLALQFKDDDEKFMRFVCCVLDANAFEVTLGNEDCRSSVRGLYPLASLANHSCVPNTIHVFDEQQRMVVKAAVFIRKDTEIFHSYTRLIWGTITRLYHLHKTKHFICKCARCEDPTEFGTYIGSILCKTCRGIVSPVNPHKMFTRWRCQDCQNIRTAKDVLELNKMLGSILGGIRNDDFPFMYTFLNGKLMSVVPDNNQVATELKYKIVWVLGHKEGYTWKELPAKHLEIKENICNDLLTLLEKLQCGQSKMRGLLLYELFCCKRESMNRCAGREVNSIPENIRAILSEAASILQYDFTAPEEVKLFLAGSCRKK